MTLTGEKPAVSAISVTSALQRSRSVTLSARIGGYAPRRRPFERGHVPACEPHHAFARRAPLVIVARNSLGTGDLLILDRGLEHRTAVELPDGVALHFLP